MNDFFGVSVQYGKAEDVGMRICSSGKRIAKADKRPSKGFTGEKGVVP